jgi:protein-disulfide isomerase
MPRTPRPMTPAQKRATTAPASPRRAAIIAIAITVALVAALAAIIVTTLNRPAPLALTEQPPTGELVTAETHRLTDPAEPEVTVVEFLDFECPACGTWHPVVSDLVARYGDRVEFAYRHLPLPVHGNAIAAALALEGAAAQGEATAMYDLLYDTQAEWGGRAADSQAGTFRGYAEQLGLDLDAYDAVVADPATLDRVSADAADAEALGISSTPTFVIDGEVVTLSSYDELESRIAAALGE